MKKITIVLLTAFFTLLSISSCRTHVHTQTVVRTNTPVKSVTVEALSNDISYNLDLRAVATVFADSRNLEDFEYRLNYYNNGISNLDLNRDGQVDYLRVVEMYESNVRLVIIQAVLGYNIFQDVATIVVEGRSSNNARIQIVGSSYIYGTNYIIEPVFYRSPTIYASFWAPSYVIWRSPYYWGYYPTHYHHRAPVVTNVYVNNVHVHVNTNNNYRYSNTVRNQPTVTRMQTSVSRNDYARSNPNQSFNSRNANVKNTREMQTRATSSSSNSRNTSATTTNTRTSSTNTTTTNTRQSTNAGSSSSSSRQATTTQPSNSGSTTRQSGNNTTTSSSSGSTTRQATTQPSSNQSTRQSSGASSTTSRSNTSPNRSDSNATVNSNSRSNSNATTTTRQSSSSSTTRSSGTSPSSNTNTRSSGR